MILNVNRGRIWQEEREMHKQSLTKCDLVDHYLSSFSLRGSWEVGIAVIT
jgi:hypothetical protein